MRLLLALLLAAAAARAQSVLVIAPADLQPALAEWKADREAKGMAVIVRAPEGDVQALVRGVHEKTPLTHVLLLGDVPHVPCAYRPAEAIRVWEKDARIATDAPFADLDGDEVPDLAIGRIPADDASDARAMLAKSLAYERTAPGPWMRRVNVVAGVGGFGDWVDGLLEAAARRFLSENVPASCDLHVTWGKPDSPYCPPPSKMRDVVVERMNEGALFLAYLGHGSRLSLDRVRWGRRAYEIFDEDDVSRLEAAAPPIVFYVACSTGRYDDAPDCLAEWALREPGGPIAVIASSRVSMPYANSILAKEMLDALFADGVATLGEVLARGKQRMGQPPEAWDDGRSFLESLAVSYDAEQRRKELHEHLFLYNLIGDPTLRIPRPGEVSIEAADSVAPGGALEVAGRCALEGEAVVEIVQSRLVEPGGRGGDDSDEAFARTYERANKRVRMTRRVPVQDGSFAATFEIPERASPGDYVLRVMVCAENGIATAAQPLAVKR